MAITVYNKNSKVVILLSTGVSYVDENDGSFLAESETSQGQLKIKDVAKDRYIAVEIPFAEVQDANGTAIGTDAATTITNLNERYFDVPDSVLIKSKVYAATAHSKGSLLNIYSLYKQGFVSTKSAQNNTANGLAFAMATDAAAAGDIGEAVSVGHFSGVDTSGMSVGDTIYLDSTPGQFTNVRPTTKGDIIQALGKVTKVDATDGEVFLNITPKYSVVPATVTQNFISGAFFDNAIRDVYLPVNATDNENAFLQRWNRWICPYNCKVTGLRFRRDYTTATTGTVTFGVYSNNTGSTVTLVDEQTITPNYGSGYSNYIPVDADCSAGQTYAFLLENGLDQAMGNCVFTVIIEQEL